MASNVSNDNTFRKIFTVSLVISFPFTAALFVTSKSLLYPSEAESNGLSKTATGIISGCYDLSGLLCGLILPSFINRWNYKNTFWINFLMYSMLIAAFGIVSFSESYIIFGVGKFVVLTLLGVFATPALLVMMPINFSLYPEKRGILSAAVQLCYDLAFVMWPFACSYLYNFGGYYLPFISVGCIGCSLAIMSASCMLPYSTGQDCAEMIDQKGSGKHVKTQSEPTEVLTLMTVIATPKIWLASAPFIAVSMTLGLNRVFLVQLLSHLLNPTEGELGFFFAISPFAAMISAIFVGKLSDGSYKWAVYLLCPILGSIGSIFLVLVTNFRLSEQAVMICLVLSLSCFGYGSPASFVGGFVILDDLFYNCSNFDETRSYRALLSSWNSNICYLGGRWIGNALIGGVIFDLIGFEGVAIVLSCLYLISCFCAFLSYWKMRAQTNALIVQNCYNDKNGESL